MTFDEYKTALKENVYPAGLAYNLEIPFARIAMEALVYIQKYVVCEQEKHTDIYDYCNSYLTCGASVVAAPVGRITRVYTSILGDYCQPVDYRQITYDELLCEARKKKFTETPPSDQAYGLFYIAFSGADRTEGRSTYGYYALHNQRLYLAPFLDSSEQVIIEWSGLKRTWGTNDFVSDDPEVFRVAKLFVTKEMALHYERDELIYAGAEREFREAMAELINECNEQIRVRQSNICTDSTDCSSSTCC